MSEVTEYTDCRCPRCGSPLITDGRRVWCTFVGGGDWKACSFGIDSTVNVGEVAKAAKQPYGWQPSPA